MKNRLLLLLLLLPLFTLAQSDTASTYDIKAHYTKHEYRIPMRDGVTLFTAVYVPKDASQSYPFLVERTPYGIAPYGEDNYPPRLGPSEDFPRSGYIFVYQDVRGRFQSEGQFVDIRPPIDHPKPGETDESTDMYDTVEWLLKHVSNNNGKVGIWGISYGGFYTSSSIIDSHPAIKAASPEAPMTDEYRGDDVYHGGAFMLNGVFEFYSTYFRGHKGPHYPPKNFPEFLYGTTDAYEYFLQHPTLAELSSLADNPWFDGNVQHNTYDAYWQSRDLSQHMHGIKCAVLTVGGWFDAEDLAGPFRTYHAIEKNNPGIFNALVVGPWVHGGWAWAQGKSIGRVQFSSATGDFYREHIILPFFEQYLKGREDAHLPEAYVFETGTNVWRQYDAWPPRNLQQKTLYLHANSKLSFDPPAANEPASDEYISDPAHPVPYLSYASLDQEREYMVGDQRFASKRPDVLTYVTDPLVEDITMAGPVSPHLEVSTSGTDSDFDVKLIDVYPAEYELSPEKESGSGRSDVAMPTEKMGGYQQLVRGEPMRAKFRNALSKPEPMIPNQITPLNFEMPDVNHTFRRGHRIMVQIQSSWFPLTDMNPQKFIDIAKATRADYVKATERVYHTTKAPSSIVIGVLPQL